MTASFAVFKKLKIKNTFNVCVSGFLPDYLQFLDIDATKHMIPGRVYYI